MVRRRGGFCYALIGLSAAALRELGFEAAMLSARVANAEGAFGPDFDHMTLLVTLNEDEVPQRWTSTPTGLPRRGPRLVDVGFGDSFLEPLLLDSRQEQAQGECGYKIVSDGADLTLMQRESVGEWKAQYRFTLQPYSYADYAEMCRYHQTSPNSHFTRARICTRATPEGRITLSEMRLIKTIHGQERTERLLTNDAEYSSVLNEHFGVVMNI